MLSSDVSTGIRSQPLGHDLQLQLEKILCELSATFPDMYQMVDTGEWKYTLIKNHLGKLREI